MSRGLGLALGGGRLSGRPAVGRVRRVVGRRDPLPLEGLRRSASVCVRTGLPSCWRLLGLPGGRRFRVGSAPQAGVVGLRRDVCGVIPARLPRVARSPTRAVSRWPCVRAPSVGGGACCGRPLPPSPALVLPCRSHSPPRRRFSLAAVSSPWPARGRAVGPPVWGAAGRAPVPGGRRGSGFGGEKPVRRAGRSCGLEGRPGPAAVAASRVVSEAACEGTFPREGLEKEASGCRPAGGGSVGPGACGGSSGPAVPPWSRALGACRGAKVGARAVR